eukprot:TRINITY_DN13145_c0_g1_i1.p1 TRINITY_DN13145_c0_g1~~TRINITY_DN13145_c0_g1_i1.p1  ORF type:complete len:319 (-),score=94.12 TRINITY_DN13145_c0_g1_i1:221-1177(-)
MFLRNRLFQKKTIKYSALFTSTLLYSFISVSTSSLNNNFLYSNCYSHSKIKTTKPNDKMQIIQIPILEDNYSYLLIDEETNQAGIIDAAESERVLQTINDYNVDITHILSTHHHWDHVASADFISNFPNAQVVGNDQRIPKLNQQVFDGDVITIGNSIQITVYFTPCHTTGHVLYYAENVQNQNQPAALFSGDTLFLGGCGRFFEGTGEQMYHALVNVCANFPADTLVFCGHEYSIGNLNFARYVEPENEALNEKYNWCLKQRENGESTVPSTIEEEISYNPFMRVDLPVIKQALGLSLGTSGEETMSALRQTKNNFK